MSTFMVVGSFSAQVGVLRSQGSLGALHISPMRGRVFLEVLADDEPSARAIVETLPMAPWWEIEVFPTMAPPPSAG